MSGAWRFDRSIEEALWAAAKEQVGDAIVRHKILVPAIARRSALYTSERENLDSVVPGDLSDLAARALFFTPADAAKVMVPVAELKGRSAFPTSDKLRVLDVGAGCGAMTLGLLACVDQSLDVLALDKDRDALALFERTVALLEDERLDLETRRAEIGVLPDGRWDVVVCGSVLNELEENEASALIRELIGRLTSEGVLIVIEPALRESSRRLHKLRDSVLSESLAHVFAPCTRSKTPCPALELERDWCHEDRPFEPTPRLAALTNATGMRAHRLKFSYLVLTQKQHNVAETDGLVRIVSSLRKSKGKSELYVCGDDCGESGREKIRLQKRDRTAATRAFNRARRGQLLEIGDKSFRLIDPCDS